MRVRNITSIIEVITEEEGMESRKRRHYKSRHSSDGKGKSEELSEEVVTDSPDSSLSDSNGEKPKKAHRYQSTAKVSRHGLFHGVKSNHGNVKQDVNVTVNIDQGEDTLDKIAGCFGRCFGKSAKAAAE